MLINNDDFRAIFSGQSPLERSAVNRLVEAVATGRPSAIGVDLLESNPDGLTPTPRVPVVWAQAGIYSHTNGHFHLLPASPVNPSVVLGPVVFPLDDDQKVRRYRRSLQTDQGLKQSFTSALLDAAHVQRPVDMRDRYIDFEPTHDRVVLSASTVLNLSNEEGWSSDSSLRGKIVLIGGAYSAQDEHETPLGWMVGSEILAHVLETELLGTGNIVTKPWMRAAAPLVFAILLSLALQTLRLRLAALAAFAIAACLTGALLIASAIAFEASQGFLFVASCGLATLLQEIYVGAWELRSKVLRGVQVEQSPPD